MITLRDDLSEGGLEFEKSARLSLMDAEAAQRAANRVGLITLPIGVALVVAPSQAGQLLRVGAHPVALRVIGVLDLALVPGLLLNGGRWQWLTARAGLNMGIAAYCLRLVRRGQAPGAGVGAAAMLTATVADTQAIIALRRAAAESTDAPGDHPVQHSHH